VTPDQQFILSLLTSPFATTLLAIISGVVIYFVQRATSADKAKILADQRQQDLLDRQAMADAALKVAQAAAQAASESKQTLALVHTAVLDNTALTQVAVAGAQSANNEANDVNKKIQAALDIGNAALGQPPHPVTVKQP
jgi:hypothetical protein